ncbi:MAG TPA: rhodanese-like domain-containing protein [Candidatus Norongarragalinales archaeon]|jgi:rhodanese-related sulfurtransferase|nr:rhodanese-like domain-containing protein [Candidatus Norongarragalinales archaeon]
MSIKNISPAELQHALDAREDLVLIDVRMPIEWNSLHIPQARHVPLMQIAKVIDEVPKTKRVVTICAHGNRSQAACGILHAAGFANCENVAGGMAAFVKWKHEAGKISQKEFEQELERVERPR